MNKSASLALTTVLLCCPSIFAQAPNPPFIDMHVHGTNTTPQGLNTRFTQLNLRYVFLAGLAADIETWRQTVDPNRFVPGLTFPCPAARHIHTGRPCFPGQNDFPDLAWLRGQVESKHILALGEIGLQYLGLSPDDPRMEPYWQLAEEFDLPVGIHMGSGPPGIAIEAKQTALAAPGYRMSAGDPLLLENVLVRHPRLRIFVMHAGWPRLESMVALLAMYPNVYVDVAALSAPFVVPQVSYRKFLRELIDQGFSKRILFGSDFPSEVSRGIKLITEADFLTPDQKSDILCANAARFLKLDPTLCSASQNPPPPGEN